VDQLQKTFGHASITTTMSTGELSWILPPSGVFLALGAIFCSRRGSPRCVRNYT